MAANQYLGVGGVARKVKSQFVGIGGVARKVKQGFLGVGGVARRFFSGAVEVVKSGTTGTVADRVFQVTFDSQVPAFSKAVVWISMPSLYRSVYTPGYGSSRGLVVPSNDDDEETPVSISMVSGDGQNATGGYEYEYFYSDSEATFYNAELRTEVTRSGLKVWLEVTYYDPDYGTTLTGTTSLNIESWKVTFTCEGE